MSLVEKQPKEFQMTFSAPRSPPQGGSDQPPAGADRPFLRAVSSADDGREGTGTRSIAAQGFIVEWQLAVAVGGLQ